MRRLMVVAVLTVVLTLTAGHVHAAGVLPPWPMYAGQSFGSDNYWIDPVRQEYFWNEASFSGFIGFPNGNVFGLTENSIAQGSTLSNSPSTPLYNQYVPNYLYCISDFLGFTAGFCVKDFRLATTVAYAPFSYGAPQRVPNGGDVAILGQALNTFGGGTMDPNTSLWPNAGAVIPGLNNFAVNPYSGIPFKGMTVGVTTYVPVGPDTGPQKNLVGIVDDTATALKIPFRLGKTYTLAYTWMKGNFFRISGPQITNYDRGAPVYVSTKDANGNPCASMVGLIEVELRNGKGWAQNYISTVVPAIRKVIDQPVEVAGGNCRWAFTWPVKVGTLSMNQTQYNTATAAYTNVNQALTAQSSSGTQWQDVIGDVDPNITSIGYTDNGDPTQPVVQVTYACQPNGLNCPGAPDIQRAILNARDVNNPTGPTVATWLSSQHVAGLQVEVDAPVKDANGVYQADDNSYMPALAGSCAGQPGC